MNPLLPRAELVSDSGGTSVITYLERVKNDCVAAVRARSEENERETALQTPESGVKLSWGKRRVREAVFSFVLISH